MPAQPAMDSDVLAHLHQLYKEQPMPESARSAKQLKKSERPPAVHIRASQHEPTKNNEATPEQDETEQPTGSEITTTVTNNQNNIPT